MKNLIIIDFDPERERPLIIGKGLDCKPPTTKEEAKEMILGDLACMCDAVLTMIHLADQNSYADKHEIIPKIIDELNKYLSLPSTKEDE